MTIYEATERLQGLNRWLGQSDGAGIPGCEEIRNAIDTVAAVLLPPPEDNKGKEEDDESVD